MRAAEDPESRQEGAPGNVRFGEPSYREIVFTEF